MKKLILIMLLILSNYCGTITLGNLVVNGDFEMGNTGFSTSYGFTLPGSGGTLEGYYAIGTDPHSYNPLGTSYGDHTSGTGNMMIVNGALSPNVTVWQQTISVSPNTKYKFSLWLSNWCPSSYHYVPAELEYFINGNSIESSLISTIPGVWTEFSYTWQSESSTTATIRIVDKQTAYLGNDFAIDDMNFVPERVALLQSIDIIGPNSVPEESDTQYQVIGYYDEGSSKDITADANLTVVPDEFAQIDSNGLLTTFRLYRPKETCTIFADCQGLSDSKPITIYPVCDGNECTPLQLARRDIADVIKIKQGVMDDLKYAIKIERASFQLLMQANSDKRCVWQRDHYGQLTKARMRILSAIMWELWANNKVDASIDSLEDALKLLQSVKPVSGPK